MYNITNPVYNDLLSTKILKKSNKLHIISKVTRDKKIKVLQDPREQIIFLEKYITTEKHYSSVTRDEKRNNNHIELIVDGKLKRFPLINDELRRFNQFKKFIKNKTVLDYGCGFGKFIFLCQKYSKKIFGVELRELTLKYLKKKKINVKSKIEDFNFKFDLITMFHVLEHLPNQIESLKKANSKLKKGGKIIIEVPHSKDYLFGFKNLLSFKKFTFYSEHLILHTEKSLTAFLKKANFKKIKIIYFQRYNFFNHLKWFNEGRPGGHLDKNYVYKDKIIKHYSDYLCRLKKTDTIIAIAEK